MQDKKSKGLVVYNTGSGKLAREVGEILKELEIKNIDVAEYSGPKGRKYYDDIDAWIKGNIKKYNVDFTLDLQDTIKGFGIDLEVWYFPLNKKLGEILYKYEELAPKIEVEDGHYWYDFHIDTWSHPANFDHMVLMIYHSPSIRATEAYLFVLDLCRFLLENYKRKI